MVKRSGGWSLLTSRTATNLLLVPSPLRLVSSIFFFDLFSLHDMVQMISSGLVSVRLVLRHCVFKDGLFLDDSLDTKDGFVF